MFCAARSCGRSSGLLIERCSQWLSPTCLAGCAARVWSLRGRCCAGIGRLCVGGGAGSPAGVVGRRCRLRCASWCCGWPGRIRARVIGGSVANWPSSAYGFRPPASAGCLRVLGWSPHRVAQDRAGVSSCACKRRASWRAISSLSRVSPLLRVVLHRPRQSSGLACRLHEESHRRLGYPAGTQTAASTSQTRASAS